MFESILNASWWPWSRTKATATTAPPISTNANWMVTAVNDSRAPSSSLPPLPETSAGQTNATHRLWFESTVAWSLPSSTTTTPSATPPDSPTYISDIDSSDSTMFDFTRSSFYNAINSAINWTQAADDDLMGSSMLSTGSIGRGRSRGNVDFDTSNLTTMFDNYTANYTNGTQKWATVDIRAAVGTNNTDYYSWLMVTPWNCSTCRSTPFDSFNSGDNVSVLANSTNDTVYDLGGLDDSSIYLIQIIITALVLGIVILSTVIGKCYFHLFSPSYFHINRSLHSSVHSFVDSCLMGIIINPLGSYNTNRLTISS